jgi:eukaryotic-like serine/threonine-protein kinase
MSALERAPVLPKYELQERIGVGGMATVYRAKDRRLGRDVAVKLIHSHLRENPEVAARFVSEARAVARLRHPNIVEVFDISDEDEPERYLVVELVRGTTLRALLSRHKCLPPELSAAIGLEIASALTHAHEEGIIHRDVKPENVLVDLSSAASGPSGGNEGGPRSKIKLTDFGIAKLLDAQGVTSTGQVLGSPAHMAPEQIEGGDVGPRADVFALGVLLYECMVGRLPFDGKNPAQVLRRVLDGTYPPADREEPRVGARWAAILARALARNAEDRYDSIDAFAQAMRAELERTGVPEPRVEVIVSAGEKARAGRDFALASAEFNRALAYRPGDSDLVRRVSAIVRRNRLFAVSRAVALAAFALAGLAASALFVQHRLELRREARARSEAADKARAAGATAAAQKGVVATAVSAVPETAGPSPAPRRPLSPREPPHKRPETTTATRKVIVDVTGPKGGYLKIDGTQIDQWFGVEHELSVGPHTFEFVPNQPECCRPSPPVTKIIEEGETDYRVPLTVAFRDARLLVGRSPPGVLRCRQLFGQDLTVPGELAVPLSSLSAKGPCVFTPTDSTLTLPVTKEVTLTAGRTTEVSWP